MARTRGPALSEAEEGRIRGLLEAGKSLSEVSTRTGRARTAVKLREYDQIVDEAQ